MSKIDLHIHSNCSDDGELTPKDIITACKEQDMMLISITDHNCVRGVEEGIRLAETAGIQMVSGVELDCTYEGRGFHLLGYDFDFRRIEFKEIEQDILHQEQDAAEEKVNRFCKATGIPLKLDDVLALAENGIVTGELIAEILLSREDAKEHKLLEPYLPGGEKCDMPHVRFYWDFFSDGKIGYVPIHYLSLQEAAALIREAGGVSVLAHPGQNLSIEDTLLPGILAADINGIEVFSSYHSKEVASYYEKMAQQCNRMVTCGSDFHGKHKPNIHLGGHHAYWDDEKLLMQLFQK